MPPFGTCAWSPFLSVYEQIEGRARLTNRCARRTPAVVNELYDEEFDESLFELLTTPATCTGSSSGPAVAEDADRIVTQHFSQLIRESESMVDAMAREFGSREMDLVEQEIDLFAETLRARAPLEPAFEDFLGKLVKKIGKGVKAPSPGTA